MPQARATLPRAQPVDPWGTAAGGAAAAATTVLGSGIPSGDACPHAALRGVPGVTDTDAAVEQLTTLWANALRMADDA
jgi:hypothetical protein